MKKFFVIFCIFIAHLSAYAQDYKTFFGLGYGKEKATYTSQNLKTDDEVLHDELSFRIGLEDEISRVYSTFYYIDDDDSIDYTKYILMLHLEALSTMYVINDKNLSLFYGVQMGALNIDYKNFNNTGFTYGLQGGFIFNLSKNISLEAGYRMARSPLSIEGVKFRSSKNTYLALNYIF